MTVLSGVLFIAGIVLALIFIPDILYWTARNTVAFVVIMLLVIPVLFWGGVLVRWGKHLVSVMKR